MNGKKSYVGFGLYIAAMVAVRLDPNGAEVWSAVADVALGIAGIGLAHKMEKSACVTRS